MNKLMMKFLENRNITPEMLELFESAEHSDLENVDLLCDHLFRIKEERSKITVLPDFDMDGIMSGTIGYAGLSQLGFDVELFIPNPSDGYGFGPAQIDRLLEEHPGTQAIITCDTGIGCRNGVQYAIGKGLEVLITDHHLENEETTVKPYAAVCVDPCCLSESYEHPEICGAHVLWQCLDHYARKYGTPEDVERIGNLRVFAGIGTISDIMPVLYENRSLIRDAEDIFMKTWSCDKEFLSSFEDAPAPYKEAFRGIYAAGKVFSDKKKLSDAASLNEEFFGFYMAPAFNSAKRLDGDMSRAFGVFTQANHVADMKYMFDLNEKRKNIVSQKHKELVSQDNPLAPHCYIADAPPGILGLLAMKMLVDTGEPCVVVRQCENGGYSGSGRSPEWYPFLTAHRDKFRVAGHEGAFGCGFESYAELEELWQDVSSSSARLKQELPPEAFEAHPDIVIDADGSGDIGLEPDVFIEFVEELDSFRPFGRGFEKPVLALRFDASEADWRVIGQKNNHLKITLPGLDVLCWNQAGIIEGGIPSGTVKVFGNLGINEYNGRRTAQMIGDISF